MDDKQAIKVLLYMLNKYELTPEEKEAILKVIGILSWTSLSKSNIKAIKDKKIE